MVAEARIPSPNALKSPPQTRAGPPAHSGRHRVLDAISSVSGVASFINVSLGAAMLRFETLADQSQLVRGRQPRPSGTVAAVHVRTRGSRGNLLGRDDGVQGQRTHRAIPETEVEHAEVATPPEQTRTPELLP